MSEQSVRYRRDGGIGWITLNRPEALNAIDGGMLKRLDAILQKAEIDDEVQGLIVLGAGDRAFSAGADVEWLSTASPLQVRELARDAVSVNARIERLGKIVIAAINGYALGGGLELAESCTLRVAASTARLGHPEVRIGAIAGWGGTTRLPRLVGRTRAAELLLTGAMIGAPEAHRIGLVNRVVEPERLIEEAQALAHRILAQAPAAVRFTLEAMRSGLELTVDQSALIGADFFGLAAGTEDFREGTAAFLAKREPSFSGR